uniref:Uncharacterized protein n=1 Tax=Brassica oleracea var. oleracea TaxID=109376 RepID=A0A0D3A6Y6_BRAOL
MDRDEWELLDRQVLGVIRLTLSKTVVSNGAKEKTTEGLMKVLSDMYEKPSANNKVFLMEKLFHLKMEEGDLVAAHVNEFNQLSSVEIEFDDEVRALILLASLPNSWEPMRAAVSNSVGTQKLKFNDVRDRILAEEVRRIDSGEASTSSAFNVENRGRNPDRNNRSNGRSKSMNGQVGIGDINLKMSDRRVWKITKVRHVPKLMRNLISVSQLDDTGHDVNFGGGAWRVKKGLMVVARGHKRGTLYMTTSYQDIVVVVENAKRTKLLHCRLGHMSEKGMKLMVENGALPVLKTRKEPGAVDLEDILTPELPHDTATAEEEISQDKSGEAEESDDSEVTEASLNVMRKLCKLMSRSSGSLQ